MGRAGKTGVETVKRAQNFYGFVGTFHFRVHQCGFECANVALIIAWGAVPRRRHDALIVIDLGVLDAYPVRECAARRFGEANAFDFLRPGFWVEFLCVGCRAVAGLDVGDQLLEEVFLLMNGPLGFECPSGRAAKCRE